MRHQILWIGVCLFLVSNTCAEVTLSVDGLRAQIKNEYVELNFTEYGYADTCKINGKNIANSEVITFSLDYTGGGHAIFSPNSIHIVEQSSKIVHFYWRQNYTYDDLAIELHYIMEDGLSGVYSYVKFENGVSLLQAKTSYVLDRSIFTQGASQEKIGTVPTPEELRNLTIIQDSTWQFPNGTYYSDYDYAAYIRETHYQGLCGNGYGAFVISPSREYHGGGPLKQELTVDSFIMVTNYFMSAHLSGTPELNSPSGWTHIYGPFLLYFPTGDNDQIMAQVENQVNTEIGKWPYSFVNDETYPVSRGSISGTITGQTNATVVAWDSMDEDFDMQELGYLFYNQTDSNGNFVINGIRPGTYRVLAYPLAGQGTENRDEKLVNVTAGEQEKVSLNLPEPKNILWSLGQANRRSDEFKFADQPRNYQWMEMIPDTLNFTIGENDPKTDWYYAQTKPGHWYIKYNDTNETKTVRKLRIALAAASKEPHLIVYVNGIKVGDDDSYGNDQAIYRSAMQSGRYHSRMYIVEPSQVLNGENVIDLYLHRGQVMYDAISLQKFLDS